MTPEDRGVAGLPPSDLGKSGEEDVRPVRESGDPAELNRHDQRDECPLARVRFAPRLKVFVKGAQERVNRGGATSSPLRNLPQAHRMNMPGLNRQPSSDCQATVNPLPPAFRSTCAGGVLSLIG